MLTCAHSGDVITFQRPRATPIINATTSIEDPSNGWVDPHGVLHMVVHYKGNQGATMHSPNMGIDWVFNATTQAYPPYINYADGTWQCIKVL